MASPDREVPSGSDGPRQGHEYSPSGEPEADQALAARDQTAADRDEADAALDQAASDRDQAASDKEQRAADEVEAAGQDDLASGSVSAAHERGRETREEASVDRAEASSSRMAATASRSATAAERGAVAAERDQAAAERDRVARRRDELADARDEEFARIERTRGLNDRGRGSEQLVVLRAVDDRRRGAEVRRRAAAERSAAAREREQAALDRRHALADRELAASELARAGVDELTTALRRGVGLAALEREIDRSRRVGQSLLLAFVDVDGLKRVNDEAGHLAGDDLLKRVAGQLHLNLRPYDLVVRYGGDEFLCAVPDAGMDVVRSQLDQASAQLAATSEGGSFSVGFAELRADDSIQDLIQRADAACLYRRYQHRLQRERLGASQLALERLFRPPGPPG